VGHVDRVGPLGLLLALRERRAVWERVDIDALAAIGVEAVRAVSEPGKSRHGRSLREKDRPGRSRSLGSMRRVLPGFFAIAAAYADGRGAHGLAFDALLCAIPLAAVSALEAFGAFLDARDDTVTGVQAVLWALA